MRFLWIIVLLVASVGAVPAQAQTLFEQLVMPGPLSSAHAALEPTCESCHESFSQGAQPTLCLDCHKGLAADIADKRGYHGRSPEALALECSHCHVEHEGRDAALIVLDPEVFDHRLTDFELKGAHLAAPCAGCHEADKGFREAPVACVQCHQDVDAHRGALGTDCAECHSETAWLDVRAFDHSKTDFPLVGSHADVACTACHQNEVYKDLPTTCIGCHRIQDVHQNRFGDKCDSCHKITRWTEVTFNHDTDTDFALLGAHREAGCNACHTENAFEHPTSTACIDCHRADDAHAGEFGTDCASCHNPAGWRQEVRFDHDLTAFPLLGQHAVVPCESCHVGSALTKVDTTCVSCHAADDVHKGAMGTDCATCHNPNGWPLWIFDHTRQTSFPLTGAHDGLVCDACHAPGTRAAEQPSACIDCHRADDKHSGNFGTDCGFCHTTEDFKTVRMQ